MNNRLKFRVWSVNDRRFIKSIYHDHADCYIFINAMYGNPVILSKYGDEVELDEKDYVIQQYTGLKDKNGNEIYEGDVIRGMHDFGPAGFHSVTCSVRWNNEVGYQWNYWDLSTTEVIGNIFENPELIN